MPLLSLDNVAVAGNFQGKGIGRRLIDFAEAEARRRGFGEIRLYTHQTMHENIAPAGLNLIEQHFQLALRVAHRSARGIVYGFEVHLAREVAERVLRVVRKEVAEGK